MDDSGVTSLTDSLCSGDVVRWLPVRLSIGNESGMAEIKPFKQMCWDFFCVVSCVAQSLIVLMGNQDTERPQLELYGTEFRPLFDIIRRRPHMSSSRQPALVFIPVAAIMHRW